jgi:regulator of RNase E activity RraA
MRRSKMTDGAGLLTLIRERLFTAVLGDVMDAAGYRSQFLPPYLKPVVEGPRLVGRAMTVVETDLDQDLEHEGDFGLMFKALDDLAPGEIYVCAGSTGAFALWGELMSTRAMTGGGLGAVVDGYHRDTAGIRRLGFPVYSRGAYGQDQRPRGAVTDFRCPVRFSNSVVVNCGDVIVADLDGVVAIPATAATDIVGAALEKLDIEQDVQRAISDGETTTSIFARTGVM